MSDGHIGLGGLLRGRRLGLMAGVAALLAIVSAVVYATVWQDGGDRSDPERARIERIVHDYILAHPEILPQAMEALKARETASLVDQHRRQIETPFHGAWAGAPNGDVVLVEFFDYACGYCRASNPDVSRLLREDPKLKVVWRELPVLGEDSVAAARVSLAAAKQGRFALFHEQMFAAGRPTAASISSVHRKVGVTPEQSIEYDEEIDRNYELARALGATGTPTFVVGGKVLQGAVGYAALKQAIAEARRRRA